VAIRDKRDAFDVNVINIRENRIGICSTFAALQLEAIMIAIKSVYDHKMVCNLKKFRLFFLNYRVNQNINYNYI